MSDCATQWFNIKFLEKEHFFLPLCQLSIEPKEAGTLTTQLQVYSFPVVCEVQQVTHSVGPVLALEVVAEEPQVEV